MSTIPCGKCANYDAMLASMGKDTKKGWCAVKSLYPTKEGHNQVFPTGCQRVEAGKLAVPYIVKVDQIVTSCPSARETTQDMVAAKRALLGFKG